VALFTITLMTVSCQKIGSSQAPSLHYSRMST